MAAAKRGKKRTRGTGGKLPPGAKDGTSKRGPRRPKWDREARELWYGGILIKRFTGEPTLQELILDAFEEEGWPDEIFDPIPPTEARQEHRLRQIVYNLNQHHAVRCIEFHVT